MKRIKMHDLTKGDIYTKELKIRSREAFQVTEKELNHIMVISRNDPGRVPKETRKEIKGTVILLRNVLTNKTY